MCRWSSAAIAAVLVLAAAPEVRADGLADARKAVDGSDYVGARTALEQALESGTAGPGELGEIFRLTGIVEGALGNEKAATDAFARWLALDAKAALPNGTSPKIMRPFTAASDAAKKRGPLEAKAETADNPPSVTLVIVNDPLKMIASAKVTFTVDRGAEQVLEADGKQRISLELGIGKRIDLRLHGLDRHGNRVVELGSKDVPIVITSSGATTPVVEPVDRDRLVTKKDQRAAPEAPRSWYAQWWVWGIATGVATGVTGYFAWRTYDGVRELDYLNDNSLAHPFSDAQAVESAAKRDLLVANISAGAAGAFALGAVILFFTRPRDPHEEASQSVSVSVAPTDRGGAFVLGGRF